MDTYLPVLKSLALRNGALSKIQVALRELQELSEADALPDSAWEAAVAASTPLLEQMIGACGVEAGQVGDVVQDVLVVIFLHLEDATGANGLPELAGWLAQVVLSKAMNVHRLAKRQHADNLEASLAAGQEPADPQPGPVQQMERLEEQDGVWAALEELRATVGDENIRLIQMRFLEGRTVKDVAAALGISEGAVCQRQFRILLKMRNSQKLKDLWRNRGGVMELPGGRR